MHCAIWKSKGAISSTSSLVFASSSTSFSFPASSN
ncbi:hypothetical protein AWRI1631_47380 [Saccharomyces cerevisiae AWRI1631]|uniref:Uncharacterized protein n=1 Tax=Saccharomyces cerevisiae (strain AWRI1631) TaxID=545124 RepID=B5VH47_YEAS6|nr:hypothetical protein AWRI1631_47380 [Saccharomyces cerevisiae AWRI1631]